MFIEGIANEGHKVRYEMSGWVQPCASVTLMLKVAYADNLRSATLLDSGQIVASYKRKNPISDEVRKQILQWGENGPISESASDKLPVRLVRASAA